jgi:hypothetical protein
VPGKRNAKSKRTPKPAGTDPRRQLFEALVPGPCSFCGRTPAEHEGLQFQRGEYRVCADCVSAMHRELKEEVHEDKP